MARASATRRAMPPDSSAGISCAAPRSPTACSFVSTMLRISALGQVGVLAQRERDVLEHVDVGEQRAVLEQHAHAPAQRVQLARARGARRRCRRTAPGRWSGLICPVISRSSVVLPVPLGPMMRRDAAARNRTGSARRRSRGRRPNSERREFRRSCRCAGLGGRRARAQHSTPFRFVIAVSSGSGLGRFLLQLRSCSCRCAPGR